MPNFRIPNSDFTPHAAGTFEGRIVAVEDKGEVETQYGVKPKIVIVIESATECMDDGRPCSASFWCTLSGSTKSKLYKARTSLLGRDLTAEERTNFHDTELIGKRVGYQVVHTVGREGGIFANIDLIWPLAQAHATANDAFDKEEEIPF